MFKQTLTNPSNNHPFSVSMASLLMMSTIQILVSAKNSWEKKDITYQRTRQFVSRLVGSGQEIS
jgi:hypothetical protein